MEAQKRKIHKGSTLVVIKFYFYEPFPSIYSIKLAFDVFLDWGLKAKYMKTTRMMTAIKNAIRVELCMFMIFMCMCQ